MAETIFLCLGTNLGEREANLSAAVSALKGFTTIIAVSPIYETAPWGYAQQPAFLNQVIEVETAISAADLLVRIKAIEEELGRQPTFRYGPRVIDIDILLYGQAQIHTPTLVVPHPRLAERAFVLVPLADLASELVVPGIGRRVKDLLAAVDRAGVTLWPSK